MAWWVLAAKALPYIAAALSGSKKKSGANDGVYNRIESLMPGQNWDNPYVNKATDFYNNAMSNDYSAISSAQRNRMWNQRSQNIRNDIIKPSENNLASRLSRSGLAGSRLGAKALSNQSASANRLLSDTYNSIEDQNVQYTQQGRQQAFGMAPSLANMYNNQQTAAADAWIRYANARNGKQDESNNNAAMFQMLGDALANWGGGSGSSKK